MANPKLDIEISARLDNLDRDFGKVSAMARDTAGKVERSFSGLGSSLRSSIGLLAGAFSVSAFAGLVTGAVDAQDHLNDLSKSTSISVESLAGLGSAARKSGGDLDSIAASINKLSVNMGKDSEKFAAIGVTAKDPIEAFKQLADVFSSIEDPQKRAAFGAEALGKSWAGAAPLLAEGGAKIGEMVERGTKLSQITTESAEAADKLNDQLSDLGTTMDGFKNSVANDMVGPLTEVTKAIQMAYEESGKLSALWAGMGALGTFMFTDEFSSTAVKIKNLKDSLSDLQADKESYNPFSVFGKSMKDIDAQILTTTEQINSLQKSLEPKPKAQADLGNPNLRPGFMDSGIDNFLNGKKASTSRAVSKQIDEGQRLLEQLKDRLLAEQKLSEVEKLQALFAGNKYKLMSRGEKDAALGLAMQIDVSRAHGKAIENINSAMVDAEESTLSLNAAQKPLYDLMNSPAWETMPDTWKEIAIAQSQAGTEAINAADDYKRLNALLDATPSTQLEKLRETMIFLGQAFEDGKISSEQFSEAAQAALGKIPEAVTETTSAMEEFSKQAARNIQDSFADFLFDPFKDGVSGMLSSFGTMIQKMIAQAVAANLAKRAFGALSGGEGEGWLGGVFKALSGVVANANGGVYASQGLSAYSGSIVSKPTVFPFANGIGLMGEAGAEAILPLKRGADGKLGVSSGGRSGHTINVYVQGQSAPDVRRAAGQGAREALAAISGGGRYR